MHLQFLIMGTYLHAVVRKQKLLAVDSANKQTGTEGIKLWDIKSQKELTSSSHHHESRGTISCAVWAMTTKTAEETLCYGTGLGYIIFLRCSVADVSARASPLTIHWHQQKTFQEISTKRLGSGFEITCLSWCSTPSEGNLCIAVGTRQNGPGSDTQRKLAAPVRLRSATWKYSTQVSGIRR